MANARDIKRKMVSIQSTQKITKAMKMVSAAKMRKSLETMLSARPYSEKMLNLVYELAKRVGNDAHPYLTKREDIKTVGLLIVTSDKGLCGAFNANVIKAAAEFVKQRSDVKIKLFLIGKKSFDFFKRRDVEIAEKWIEFAGKYSYEKADNIGKLLIRSFDEESIDELHVIFNKYKSTSTQEVVTRQILPVPIASIDEDKASTTSDYIYEPSQELLLDSLLPKYINTVVFQSMLESSAGEHGARMVAMENATKAANDIVKKLTLNYNKARQGAITTELLDIVNGAEALR